MDIIVTRYIAICGTALLAREYRAELLKRYPEWLVDEASSFDKDLEAELKENLIARKNNAFYAEEYTEFGIYEALFKISKCLKCGMDIYIKKIPVRQETVEVCEFLDVNPYALYSGYSSVIVCDNGDVLCGILEKEGIPATVIGYTTGTNDKLLINGDEKGFLPHIRKDELKNILGRRNYNERKDFIDS